MPSAQARLETDQPGRYLDQFCKHAASIGDGRHGPRMHHSGQLASGRVQLHVDRTDTDATITINPWGRCTITSEATALTFHAEARNERNLQQIQNIISGNLERFGHRDQLSLTWHQAGSLNRS